MDELLTTGEVRKALKVSKGTITKMVKAKLLNPIKFGDSYRFKAEDIKLIMECGYELPK